MSTGDLGAIVAKATYKPGWRLWLSVTPAAPLAAASLVGAVFPGAMYSPLADDLAGGAFLHVAKPPETAGPGHETVAVHVFRVPDREPSAGWVPWLKARVYDADLHGSGGERSS
jgi:hypothetical protein